MGSADHSCVRGCWSLEARPWPKVGFLHELVERQRLSCVSWLVYFQSDETNTFVDWRQMLLLLLQPLTLHDKLGLHYSHRRSWSEIRKLEVNHY